MSYLRADTLVFVVSFVVNTLLRHWHSGILWDTLVDLTLNKYDEGNEIFAIHFLKCRANAIPCCITILPVVVSTDSSGCNMIVGGSVVMIVGTGNATVVVIKIVDASLSLSTLCSLPLSSVVGDDAMSVGLTSTFSDVLSSSVS